MNTAENHGYKPTEVGVIPDDWQVRTVGSMGEVRSGKALAVRGPGQLRPYLRTKNVFDGRIDIEDVLEMPMTDTEFANYRLRYGDILLNEGQSIELVGRCAMYKDEFPLPCAIQNQLVRFRANNRTSANFATHLFRRCQATGVFSKIAMQTTSVAHLGVSRFHRLRLAWPPTKAEQEAIAAALSDADGLIESLEQLVASKQRIKHGAMQELLTGRKRLPGFAMSAASKQSEVGDIPNDWTLTPLGRLVRSVEYGSSAKSSVKGSIPVLRMGNLQDGKIDWSDLVYTNSVAEIHKYILRPGDVLFNRTNTIDLVGKTSIYEGEQPAIFAGYLIRINVLPDLLDSKFLNFILNTEFARKHSSKVLSVAVGQANINGQKLKTYPIPRPPTMAEQVAIATILSDMDTEIAELGAKLAKARLVKQAMTQELLSGRTRLV